MAAAAFIALGGSSHHARGAHAAGEGVFPIGVIALTQSTVRPFTAQADRAGSELRRPGGYRYREYAVA